MKKRLIFEDPAPISPPKAKSTIRDFIMELSKHPDRWAVFSRTSKGQSYYYKLQQDFPNLKITARQNPGRSTFTVYFMWMNDEDMNKREQKRAERRSRREQKRDEIASMPVASTGAIALPTSLDRLG